MTRIAAQAIALLLVYVSLTGCAHDHEDKPHSLFLCSDESVGGPAAQADIGQTGSAQPGETMADDREPAVLFVAYVATPPDILDRMLKMARVTRRDVVCDLGCGDGRIVVTAAKRYGCKAIGYDLDHLRVQEARRNAEKNGVAHRVTIEQKDILQADLREATVVTLYLSPKLNERLIPQLQTLRPGSRIVSHDFDLADIPPDKVVEMTSREDRRKHTIYLWTCPLKTNARQQAPQP